MLLLHELKLLMILMLVITVTADAASGLTDGSVQDALVALATRVKGLEDAGLEGAG